MTISILSFIQFRVSFNPSFSDIVSVQFKLSSVSMTILSKVVLVKSQINLTKFLIVIDSFVDKCHEVPGSPLVANKNVALTTSLICIKLLSEYPPPWR